MKIEVIEFELTCPEHGPHNIIVPVELPRPSRCAHCFLPVSGRVELRRFTLEGPLPNAVGNEAYVG
jgi:hypothetical protein